MIKFQNQFKKYIYSVPRPSSLASFPGYVCVYIGIVLISPVIFLECFRIVYKQEEL